MSTQSEEMRRELEEIFDAFPHIHTNDIPGIDLYMDQVTTFLQDNLRGLSRDPEGDKFLTKTMINNYVKNKVLFPPVKKKYNRDHIMLLIVIYYMKSFLSIGDIRSVIGPIMDRYAEIPMDRKKDTADRKKEPADRRKDSADRKKEQAERGEEPLRIRDIYESLFSDIEAELPRIREDMEESIQFASERFGDLPEEEREELQRLSLICRLSAEVYMRKIFIEKLLDAGNTQE
jgi:rRNA processing protein Gar1